MDLGYLTGVLVGLHCRNAQIDLIRPELVPLLPATLGLRMQAMSSNVGEEQVHDTLSTSRLLPEDESQSRIKEERKEEDVTPKS